MRVRDVMSRDLQIVSPETLLMEAGQQLLDWDVHSVPVCDRGQLVGLVSDWDLTVRAKSRGLDAHRTLVREVASRHAAYASPDDDVESTASLMRERHLDRLPVVDQARQLVGILSADRIPGTAAQRVVEDVTGEVYRPSARR